MTTSSDSGKAFGTIHEYQNHLEDLWGLRSAYSKLAKDRFDLQVAFEKQTTESDQRLKKSLAVGVEIADELRRLVDTAKGNIEPIEEEKASLFGRMFGKKTETTPEAVDSEWIAAFERLWGMARNRLESIGVELIELLGKDLRTEEYDGQLIKRMVSVKNKPDGDALIVKRENRGLWLLTSGEQLIIVQRGEVLV